MTPHVALVYFEGCSHAEEARNRLREALALLPLPSAWTEWDTEHRARIAAREGVRTRIADGAGVSGSLFGALWSAGCR